MSTGTSFKLEILIPDIYKIEIPDKLDIVNFHMDSVRSELLALCSQSPTENRDAEGYNIPWHEFVSHEFQELIEKYDECLLEQYRLERAMENIKKCKDYM